MARLVINSSMESKAPLLIGCITRTFAHYDLNRKYTIRFPYNFRVVIDPRLGK